MAKEKKQLKRQYIGPPYQKGLVLNIPQIREPMDMKSWSSERTERMIAKYPQISKYFSEPK